jgi:hypothetical protein
MENATRPVTMRTDKRQLGLPQHRLIATASKVADTGPLNFDHARALLCQLA